MGVLACLVPLLWRPGGPWNDPGAILGRSWDDPGTVGGTRNDPVTSRLGFYRFFVDLGDPFREMFGYIWTKKHDFVISISKLLFSDDVGV